MDATPHPRDAALRELLVASVEAAPLVTPRRRARGVWRPVLAFALAGALTGGTVAIAAAAATNTPPSNVTMLSATITTPQWIRDDMTIVTDPLVTYDPQGPIRVGEKPEGATHIALNVTCFAPGAGYSIAIDDRAIGSGGCTEDDPDKLQVTYGGSGSAETVEGTGPHSVTIVGTGSIAVWLSWISIPAIPSPSDAQLAELADGVVTYDEYKAAFARFKACVEARGFPMPFTDLGDGYLYTLDSELVDSGVEALCYPLEFQQVDMEWQESQW